MEENRELLDCDSHGKGWMTFVCEHLAANPDQERFSREPTADNLWPDAWCANCDIEFEKEGEWNDKNEGCLKIKLLCHKCYEWMRSHSST